MAGGVHASSPGSATVTHQMGHSAFPPEYTLHSQTVLENGVSLNESSHNGETSTSRKRKLSTDAANHQLDTKRTCIYNHLLTEMIIEKEKYLYISLLDKYSCGDENNFLNFIDKINYSDSVLPFPNPHQPKVAYLSNEPEHFKTAFPNDLLLSGFKKVVKQESNESNPSSQTDFSSKSSYNPIVLIRPASRAFNHVGDNSQQVADKAKQEAYVLQRVAELQRSGLWSEKRLPKVQEPPRAKAHWDYVLEELEWLATDFAQERIWKKAAARKRSRMVQKHFQERQALVQKAAKAAELHKKRIAGHLAKMVKSFWSGMGKLSDFKQEMKLKEKRQRVLDQRVSSVKDKFSSSIAENASKSVLLSSQDTSRFDSPDKISDAEFEPNQSSSDDEETIEAEEKSSKTDVIDTDKEIELLKRESELPLEDLLNQLPEEYLNNVETNVKINDKKHIDEDDEYEMDIDESDDDESTLLEEEKLQGKIDYESEIAELEADNKLSVEELKKKYNLNCADVDPVINSLVSSYSESSSDDSQADSSISDDELSYDTTDDDQSEENEDEDGLLSLLKDGALENGDLNAEEELAAANEKINEIVALAESIQPDSATLSTARSITKVPFLLKHSLREYQHIGMDWLVAMHERNLNGILADEMGLGKTIQTIALLAHLASEKEDWGPHLIIVPTSVMLNWEIEFKKWCPAFKISTYCGNANERKVKRSGWSEPNTFHVCITSYKLVLQDHRCFRRKKWKYVILDEAQNIKNFKSQRWQRLLNFHSERRLLLSGAPLQNNLGELWSSVNFLMPKLFASHREFKDWFSNPVSSTNDGGDFEHSEDIVKRLHKILRPFLLRRSKSEVEKQLPKRNEQVIMCKLSNRQRYLYDDYMSRNKTKEALSSGNLLNVINVLMQLRKVCNHPNLLEPRPIVSPFQMDSLNYNTASLIDSALDYRPFEHVNLKSLNLRIIDFEQELTAWSVHRMKKLRAPKKLIEEIDDVNEPPMCPKEALNLRLKVPHDLSSIKLNNNNSKSNLKVASFFKNISTSVSPAASTSNTAAAAVVNTAPVSTSSKVKLGPIYRGMIAQGEVNNMAVKRTKLMDNTNNNKGGNLTLQLKTTKFNTVPQKICITTTSSKTPIHATVLKNVLPVTLKNTQTGTAGATESGSGVPSSSSSATAASNSSSTSVSIATPSMSFASSSGLPTVMVSTSVLSLASSSSTKLSNSISQIVQNSAGKSVILATSNSVNNTATMKTSGQKVILKNIGPGNLNTILGPIIRKPSAQQASILNNGNNAAASSSIILNNTPKTSITIPKSTFVTSTVAVSTVTSSVSQGDSVSTTVGVSNKNNRAKDEILCDNQSELVGDKRNRLARREKLRVLGEINERKSSPYVMFGCDVRNTLKILDVDGSNKSPSMNDAQYWKCAGHTNCINAQYAKHVYGLCHTLTNALSNSVKSIEERIEELSDTFSRFIVYVPAVNARRPSMRVSRPNTSKSWSLRYMECTLEKELAPRSEYLNRIVSRMSTSFPDNRLMQYDCGKLQTLDTLLHRLKLEQHRVLIFTQMARMLDMLEAFLSFRGHIYLRLDGGSKIDQRRILTERFNADERYFCFILSTRVGNIGVNLTGADTIIFYDSDWNPTMDAQTLDRCHRIGLARDLCIYRLLSERTIEESMAKKTAYKRLLSEVASRPNAPLSLPEGRLKSTTVRDLFEIDANDSDPTTKELSSNLICGVSSRMTSMSLYSAYEKALTTVEEPEDVKAAELAVAEASAEMDEFDENIPLVTDDESRILDDDGDSTVDIREIGNEVEQTVDALLSQLTPIERWALQFMETSDDPEWSTEQHLASDVDEVKLIEQQKREWEVEHFVDERNDKKVKLMENGSDPMDDEIMYSSEDSRNQAWLSFEMVERMPIWLPLPPRITIEENEEYIDRSLNNLYETSAPIPEHLLPPVYYRKEKKKLRLDQPSPNINESPSHIRVRSRHREGLNATLSVAALEPPKSIFDRPSPVVAKLRQDMRLQKYRGLPRSTVPNVPGLKPYFPPKINADPEFVPEWLIHEDYALLQGIQHVQELPLNLSVMYPGHTPNWDLVSELVNQVSRIYRSPQQCKNRFETAILPREEGKLTSDPIWKKQKKMKGVNPLVTQMKYTRNYKTAQLYVQDSNLTYTQMMNARFDAIRAVSNRRAPTLKRLPLNTTTKNPKHAQLLAECEIDYDRPLTPVEIANRRAARIAKEKQNQMAIAEQQHSQQPRPGNTNVVVPAAAAAGQPQQHIQVAKPVPAAAAQQPAAVQQTAVAQQQLLQQQQQQQLQTQTAVAVHKSISIPTSSIVSQPTAVVVNISQNSPVTTSPVTIRSIVRGQMNVQEMIVASSASPQQQSSIVIPSAKTTIAGVSAANVLTPSIQRIIPITQISTATTATGQRFVTAGSKTIASPQLQLYRQHNAVQLRQQQLKILQARGGKTSVVVPANVVVTSQAQQQQQQQQQQTVQQVQSQQGVQVQQQQQPTQQAAVQQQTLQQRQLIKSVAAGTIPTSTTRNITEAEVAAIIKKQQQQQQQQQHQQQQQIVQQQKIASATVIVTSNATNTPTQFITAQSTSTTAQNTVGVTLPTIKATNIKPAAHQIRQMQQLMAQQRKLSAQKITPIGQVVVNVTQSGGGQVISHVLTKTTSGNVASAAQFVNARVIPVVASNSGKQTYQVVSASQLRASNNNVSNVNVDGTTAAARHIQQNIPSNAIKISGGTSPVSVAALTHPQNFLNQVSAAIQNQPLAVRSGNLRIQNATIASGLVSSSASGTTSAAASSPSANNSNVTSVSGPASNNDKV